MLWRKAGPAFSDRAGFARSFGPFLWVVAGFVTSRALAFAAGVRFDATPLDYFLQYIDQELLRTRLLESVFYLHGQPPLFNLLIGVVLNLAPDHFEAAMHGIYLLLGLLQSAAIYLVLVRIGLGRWPSATVTVLLTASPGFLLYENWLFYEYPVAALLLLSALALSEFLRRGTVWSGTAFFSLLAVVIYTRTIFQPAWLLLVIVLLFRARVDLRRKVLAASILPTLAVLLLLAKNLVVFGVPTTSSWFGMNLAQVVYYAIPDAERRPLVERGELSRVSLIAPFSPPADYVRLGVPQRRTGVPALDRLWKSGGAPNMNSKLMIEVSRDYFGDSLHMIRVRPTAYMRGIVDGGKLYLRPTTKEGFVLGNRSKIEAYDDLVNRVILLQTPYVFRIGWTILVLHVLALLYGLRLTYRLLRRRVEPSLASVTLAYVWVTLAYCTVVITFTQVLENNRIRFYLDPLVVILVALPVRDGLGRLARRLMQSGVRSPS